ncbi:MAG TPA: diacylglycerol kinase family lipid kinase [Actinobacteria bacterium]|nr:diacylglycerol kinase family lipid kinase [Actinomycetota bacterium]
MKFNKAKIIVNPASNHGETRKIFDKVKDFFEEKIDFSLELTEKPKQAIDMAKKLAGYDLVVAVGGDGTIFEIVNGLALSNNRKTALGIIPMGSGNDLAKTLRIPKNITSACDEILNGRAKMIDLGLVNGVYYANSFSVGLDAQVAHTANEIKDEVKKSGVSLYLTALFKVLSKNYRPFETSIKINEGDFFTQNIVLITANNGVSYGGGFKITPKAQNDDGFLNICLVDELPAWKVVPRLPFVITGTHEWMKYIHTFRAKKIILRSEDALPAQLDGELIASNNFLIELVPRALKVIVPKEN